MQPVTVIGLMSGTSMDGVDAAVLETDGDRIAGFGPRRFRPYTEAERTTLRRALVAAPALRDRSARPGPLAEAERVVTEAHAEAVEAILGELRRPPELVGFHGQTVFHEPRRLTVQIGDAAALARRIGLPVVHDFRAADVAAGGEGAPLVPVYHRALAASAALPRPLAIVNIGGVANVTRIGTNGELLAFDTGPGNALIDDFVRARTGAAMDAGGALAAAGRVDAVLVEAMLADPWFALPPPKSLDRGAFSLAPVDHLSTADGAATLAAFTAAAIARGLALAGETAEVIVAGGGAHNPALLRLLGERIGRPARTASEVGWSVDFLEAEAFAFLAVRSLRGLPLTFPGTTGVAEPLTGGVLTLPLAA